MGFITQPILWLGKPFLAMTAVIFVNTWRGMPFFAISILAGLVSIPRSFRGDDAQPLARSVCDLAPVAAGPHGGHSVFNDFYL